ncbi:MAG: tRNA 2-thiouridine(34) synthase MnmA, partial [Rhodospirillaceae bacterium]|nr:tRNA 2-thiouridine(34) synthase MnmA [Rhodospirillaceae bacterium]
MAAQINSLGFARAPARTRVVVAMSGGVDSSVTAAMLHAGGYEVIGVTLQLYDHGAAVSRPGACCAGQDIRDARRVAEEAGFPHYVLDYETRFRESVIDDFADSYLRGETPLPCVRCNQTVKFTDLMAMARDLDADCLATGHYVRRIEAAAGPELHRAADPAKDQSYFLFATTREQLGYLRFPLGGLSKAETRRMARELDVPVAEKPDSQDICFVPNGDYARVVEKLRPGACDPGRIVDLDGNELGAHDGIIRFTVGQRRGLGVGGAAEPLYVVRIDAESREVTVGPREALARRTIAIGRLNWLGDGALEGGMLEDGAPEGRAIRAEARIRNTGAAMPCRVEADGGGGATLTFDAPQYGVAAGQAAVLYDDTRLLGGGWIAPARDP